MEDNFQTTDLPWIGSLRYTSPNEAEALMSKEKKTSSSVHPPSFYQADLEKWTTHKFEKAIEERK
jgi:hypothetical protein